MEREIKQYFELLEQLTEQEHIVRKVGDQKLAQKPLGKLLMYLEILVMVCLVISVMMNLTLKFHGLQGIDELFIFLCLFLFFVSITLVCFSKGSALTLMKENSEVDSHYLIRLRGLSTATLELGILELSHGKDWFTRGLAIFIGVFEKVGLLPALFSMIGVWLAVDNLPHGLIAAIGLYVLLYYIAIVLQRRMLRIERMLALTQLAIRLKDQP